MTDAVENDICGPQTIEPTPTPTSQPIKDDVLPKTTADCPRTWWNGKATNVITPSPTLKTTSANANWWGRRRLRSRKKMRRMVGEFKWWFNDDTPAPTKALWNTQKQTSTTEDPCARMWWNNE